MNPHLDHYLATLSTEKSRRSARDSLDIMASNLSSGQHDAVTMPWQTVRAADLVAARERLKRSQKPASVNVHLSRARRLLQHMADAGEFPLDAMAEVRAVKGFESKYKGEKGQRPRYMRRTFYPVEVQQPPPEITPAQVAEDEMYAAHRARDAAIQVFHFAEFSLRAIAALDLADYDAATGAVTQQGQTRYLPQPSRPVVAQWLEFRGERPGPLFVPLEPWARMSATAIMNAVRKA